MDLKEVKKTLLYPVEYFKEQVWNKLSPLNQTITKVVLGIIIAFSILWASYKHYYRPIQNEVTPITTTQPVIANKENAPKRYQEYLDLLNKHPTTLGPTGNHQLGEIEIVTDPKKMAEIETTMKDTIGVYAQDRYWTWIKDPVIFPNGKTGIYGRVVWKNSLEGPAGAAVLPVAQFDGQDKIFLNVNYRHATRRWECELPRGVRNPKETAIQAALRETLEETGFKLDEHDIRPLGTMAVDTGLTNSVIPIYFGKIIGQQKPKRESSEAIDKVIGLTMEQIQEGYKKGSMEQTIKGRKVQVYFSDPFLTFALFNYNK